MDPSAYIIELSKKFYEAAEGAKNNARQCRLLKERVEQVVSLALMLLPPKPGTSDEVIEQLDALVQLLISGEDLCREYHGKWGIKKFAFHSNHKQKFEDINIRLDRSLQCFAVALQINEADVQQEIHDFQKKLRDAQALDAEDIKAKMEELVNGQVRQEDMLMRLLEKIEGLETGHVVSQPNPLLASPPSTGNAFEDWEVHKKNLEFDYRVNEDDEKEKVKLGGGASGSVYAGKFMETKVAVKQINRKEQDQIVEETFRKEMRIIARLHHPNIVRCLGGIVLKSCVRMILEFLVSSMKDEIHEKRTPFSSAEKIRFMRGASRGVAYLHDIRIAHRDIKPDNLMLDEKQTIKIVDFGLSTTKASSKPGQNLMSSQGGAFAGTHGYMAPELYTSKGGGRKVDIFALGMFFYELWTSMIPFGDKNPQQMQTIMADPRLENHLPKIPEDVPANLRTALVGSWIRDPRKRLSAGQLEVLLNPDYAAILSPVIKPSAPLGPTNPFCDAGEEEEVVQERLKLQKEIELLKQRQQRRKQEKQFALAKAQKLQKQILREKETALLEKNREIEAAKKREEEEEVEGARDEKHETYTIAQETHELQERYEKRKIREETSAKENQEIQERYEKIKIREEQERLKLQKKIDLLEQRKREQQFALAKAQNVQKEILREKETVLLEKKREIKAAEKREEEKGRKIAELEAAAALNLKASEKEKGEKIAELEAAGAFLLQSNKEWDKLRRKADEESSRKMKPMCCQYKHPQGSLDAAKAGLVEDIYASPHEVMAKSQIPSSSRALEVFHSTFGKSAASFVGSDGYLMLDRGKCDTVKQAQAVARILSSNAKVEGWNLDKGEI
eukprot:UC4_evm3s414